MTGLAVAVAVIYVLLLLAMLDGGPKCRTCRATENQCHEASHYSGRPCCSKCSHAARLLTEA